MKGFLWGVEICVEKVCILLKYRYVCSEFKRKEIWKDYE